MKVVVTGGAGFIGSHIVESLLSDGHQVTVFDNFSTGSLENLAGVAGRCEVIKGDIQDYEALLRTFEGHDAVSHQAAQLEIFRSTDDPYFDLRINTFGTLNVLRAAKETRVRKVVNASSACIYGQAEGKTHELYDPRPNWAYGVSKLAAEKYCFLYNDYHGVATSSLRYGIVYGEREWYRRVLTIFIKRAVQGEPLVVFGDGAQIRDFIHVSDVVKLHNICLSDSRTDGQVYNAGTGMGTTIQSLALLVAKEAAEVLGKKVEVIFESTKEGEFSKLVTEKRRNTAELQSMWLDIERANKIGWAPTVELNIGVRAMLLWAKNNPQRWQKILYTDNHQQTAQP